MIKSLLTIALVFCGFTQIDAKISSKQEANFAVRADEIFSKLIYSRDKPTDKMFEYVLRLKKDIDKTFKVKIVTTSFLSYTFKRLKEAGFELSYEQKRFLRKGLKAKYSPLTPTQIIAIEEQIANEASVKKLEPESRLVYGACLSVAGQLLQDTKINSCVLIGNQLDEVGIAECISFLKHNS